MSYLEELLPEFRQGAKIRRKDWDKDVILKPIKGFQNYLVDNSGNVYNGLTNKKLKPFTNNKGYLMVDLQGKKKTIHRLVAIAFIENPQNKSQVNHIDGNKKNNNVNNLEWATAFENQQHAWKNGLNKRTQQQADACRLAHIKRVMCIDTGEIFNSITEASRATGANELGISLCVRNKRKTAGGLTWCLLDCRPVRRDEVTFYEDKEDE